MLLNLNKKDSSTAPPFATEEERERDPGIKVRFDFAHGGTCRHCRGKFGSLGDWPVFWTPLPPPPPPNHHTHPKSQNNR